MSGGGVRAAHRADVERRLLEVAREHLARDGAAALSVRAVARDLGLAPSALFRYVSGRDELLTRLIVAGYRDLGEEVMAALAGVGADDLDARWATLAGTVRRWGVAHPHEWALLYGSPVPGYAAPGEVTTEPGTVVIRALLEIGRDAEQQGRRPQAPLPGDRGVELAERATAPFLADDDVAAAGLSPVPLANGTTAWMLLVGAVSTEVFEGFGGGVAWDELFEYVVQTGHRLLFGTH